MRGQRLDEREFVFGQAEALAIILRPGTRIGHEDHRCGLFDQRRGDAAVERVACRLGGKADQCIALPERLQPVADAGGEHLVVERLPALVDQDHRRFTIEPLVDPVEQIHHRRRAQLGAFQQCGHVEAHHAGRQVEPVGCIVEQPAMLPVLDPCRKPVGQIARLRAAAAREQFAEVPQTTQRGIVGISRIDRSGDCRQFLRAIGSEQHAQPVAQEAAIDRIVGQGQRVEACRLA